MSWVVLVNQATHFALFIPFTGNPWLPMMSSLCHITSWQGSFHFIRVIQSAAFLPRHTHAHVQESPNIPPFPHSSPRFWRGNILDASVTLYSGIPWTTVHHLFFTFASTVSVCVSLTLHISYFCMHVLSIIWFINIQMTTWSFRDALEELEVRGHFNESVLRSALGLRLGDICFAEIQTTIKMCVVPVCTFLQFIEQGSFNADNLPLDGYSHNSAILLAFIPDTRLMDIEHVVIGNVIQRHRTLLGDISSIPVVMDSICLVLASECKKSPLKCRAYMMLIGNYGGHMAFATDPPYCVAYATDYKITNDPSKMTPHECLNHAYTMEPATWWWGGYCLCPTGSQGKGNWLQGATFSFWGACNLVPSCFQI